MQQISTNTFGCARYVVALDPTQGTHTTIQAAINSASSGDTVFIRPGIYSENPILKAGVDLATYSSEYIDHVVIIGKCSYSGTGVVTLSGIRLQTNGDFLLEVTGANASVIILKDCYVSCTNNTGISHTNSNASSQIYLYQCLGDIAAPGFSYFSKSSTGQLLIFGGQFFNTGASTSASVASAGLVFIDYTSFPNPITTSGTSSLQCKYATFTNIGNTTALTVGGSGTNLITFCDIITGTASAVMISSNLTITTCTITTTNVIAVAGSGSIAYGGVTFSNSTALAGTLVTIDTSETLPYATAGTTGTAVRGSSSFDNTQFTVSSTGFVQFIGGSSAITSVSSQSFTTPGAFTYTSTAGTSYVIVELQAGGGGGGSTTTPPLGDGVCAVGGAGGAYARFLLTAAEIGSSLSGSVGAGGAGGTAGGANNGAAGGNTTLSTSSSWICGGGTGGTGVTNIVGLDFTAGVSGGTVTTGTGVLQVRQDGGTSGYAMQQSTTGTWNFGGGSSYFGSGAPGAALVSNSTAPSVALNATSIGSGGGGALAFGLASITGGTGANGIAIFTEYV